MRAFARFPILATALVVGACTGQPTPSASQPPHATSPPTLVSTDAPATATAVPTRSPLPALGVQLVSEGTVLVGDDLGEAGHYSATLPATYFTADSTQHLYVVGFGALPGDQRNFHASSTDGISWTVDEADPLASFAGEFSPPGPIPGTVMQDSEGNWVMYFWGVPTPLFNGAQIYRATADGPVGPWTMEDEPVLPLGDRGEVDDGGLDFPSVVPTSDGFLMLYGANGGDMPHTARVLAATSDDGVTWEKQGRVMEPELCGGTHNNYIAIPRLFAVDEGYVALTVLENDMAALRSEDGSSWTCAADGPVFLGTDVKGSDRVHTVAAAADGDGIAVMIEALFTGEDSEVFSNLWLAEVTGL